MNAEIIEGCIGCGLCSDMCPEIFEMNDEGLAQVHTNPVPEELEESAREAAESCPVEVIIVE